MRTPNGPEYIVNETALSKMCADGYPCFKIISYQCASKYKVCIYTENFEICELCTRTKELRTIDREIDESSNIDKLVSLVRSYEVKDEPVTPSSDTGTQGGIAPLPPIVSTNKDENTPTNLLPSVVSSVVSPLVQSSHIPIVTSYSQTSTVPSVTSQQQDRSPIVTSQQQAYTATPQAYTATPQASQQTNNQNYAQVGQQYTVKQRNV